MQEKGIGESRNGRVKSKKGMSSDELTILTNTPRIPRLRVLGMIWIVVIVTAVLGSFALFGWIVAFPEHPPDGHVFH